jgi:hypothetical protein
MDEITSGVNDSSITGGSNMTRILTTAVKTQVEVCKRKRKT